ncbi:MAG: hypothetical protein LBE71_00340 [Dysgonamonadaceae bacterium]|jgi:hypothetical protein|nr:hypothetical protein [Dysgonamonadaceae bacterium]
MKRNMIILFFLLSVLTSAQAQETLPYKPWQEFNNDTLKYLEYNFNTRGAQYNGRTVKELFDDFELPVTFVVSRTWRDDYATGASVLVHLHLGIHSVQGEEDKPSDLYDYYVRVSFANPPLLEDFMKVFDHRISTKWTPQVYEFLKDLKLSRTGSNPYIIERRKRNAEKTGN